MIPLFIASLVALKQKLEEGARAHMGHPETVKEAQRLPTTEELQDLADSLHRGKKLSDKALMSEFDPSHPRADPDGYVAYKPLNASEPCPTCDGASSGCPVCCPRPAYKRVPVPEGCEDCPGCPDCLTEREPDDEDEPSEDLVVETSDGELGSVDEWSP